MRKKHAKLPRIQKLMRVNIYIRKDLIGHTLQKMSGDGWVFTYVKISKYFLCYIA